MPKKSQNPPVPQLDELILQDHLLQILERSPQTAQYATHRVSEIIADVLSEPIIEELRNRVEELEGVIGDLREERDAVGERNGREMEKRKGIVEKYVGRNRELEKEVARLQHVDQQNNNLKLHIEKLEKQIRELQKQATVYKQRNAKIEAELEENRNIVLKLEGDLDKLAAEHKSKCEQVQRLEGELEKVKKLCKQTKYNEIGYKKQTQKIRQDFQTASSDLSKLRQQLKTQKSHRENERKALNSKLNEFYTKSKNAQKMKKFLIKVSEQNRQIRKQLQKTKEIFLKQMKQLSEQSNKNSYMLMDQIGDQVNKELKDLMAKMARISAESRVYKEEARIKDEIIQKLEKVSTVQVMGNRELQRELKSKKMEADTLRKQLKRNYEQSENRVLNSYRQMLSSTLR